MWPFIDRTPEPTHFTADPLRRPFQTGVGVGAVAFIMIASIAGMNNILADQVLGTTTSAVNPILTAALLVVPPLFGGITYLLLRDGDSVAPPDSKPAAAPDGGDRPEGGDDD
jgi:cytochrome b-561